MRNLRGTALALAILVPGVGGCGSEATGIAVDIDPDPVEAVAQRDGTYLASWDAVVSNLTGTGGTVHSVEAEVTGASAVTAVANSSFNPAQPSPGMAVEAFARRAFRQSAQFRADSGQALAVQVTVRFTAEDEKAYQAAARARITLR
jgi:hypothetical protein